MFNKSSIFAKRKFAFLTFFIYLCKKLINMEDNKKKDMDVEGVVRDIVRHFVWERNELFKKYIPTNDEETQKKGSDYVLSDYAGKYPNLIVDEKAAFTYVNIYLPTFAFESLFKNRIGKINDGWLINESNITDAYALVWLNEANVPKDPNRNGRWDCSKITRKTIMEFEVVLILKKTILEYLASKGLTIDMIRKISYEMYEKKIPYHRFNGIKFKYGTSRNDRETPVNVLIPRPILRELSIYKKILSIL